MTHLVIQLRQCDTWDACALCGGEAASTGGVALVVADTADAVCRACGKRHAPALAALLDLAGAAERVGRIGRHTVTPPLTALLELARAAENYSHTAPRPAPAVA